jgi:hypothetical protein
MAKKLMRSNPIVLIQSISFDYQKVSTSNLAGLLVYSRHFLRFAAEIYIAYTGNKRNVMSSVAYIFKDWQQRKHSSSVIKISNIDYDHFLNYILILEF